MKLHYMYNSLFEGNRKSSSTGNEGAGIYNNGTATIINSTFQNNYARWGTILSDYKLTIINSTIKNNIAYDGTSTYKFGAGIAINTGEADYFNPYRNDGIDTKILNCNFTNKQIYMLVKEIYLYQNVNLIIVLESI